MKASTCFQDAQRLLDVGKRTGRELILTGKGKAMNEMQKAAAGLLYDANYDEELIRFRDHAKAVLFDFNHTHPRQAEKRKDLLKSLLSKTGENFLIEAPFHCDYGFNIEIGENSTPTSISSSLTARR
ncbi:maltose acetyltransferase domain-containing protein [Mesorhizobium sp. KR2-14]|uniref:maltose acetyltransferase domain-containing protein n=1 Tax=Mesorhizobium sp. KR2-14 TaxID=3156610 RepID=UPI0032B568B8